MTKVLVTGGAGFFGLHLAMALAEKGYDPIIYDLDEPVQLNLPANVQYIKGDIRDQQALSAVLKDVAFVFHNAALVPISRATRKTFWSVNVEGTKTVLDACLEQQVKKIVFVSSSAPYGIPKQLPITEKTPFNPVCNYGKSKIEAENICKQYREKGLDIVILRPRTLIGKGRLGIFQILYSWIADNKKVYLIGKGDNLFQDLGVDDFASACILAMEKDCKNEDFNLGTDRYATVKEELEDLISYAKSSSKLVGIPAEFARFCLGILDILNLSPFTTWHYKTADKPFYFDSSKAMNVLGWKPQMSSSDMFRQSYEWYLANRRQIDAHEGTSHRYSAKQKILKLLKRMS